MVLNKTLNKKQNTIFTFTFQVTTNIKIIQTCMYRGNNFKLYCAFTNCIIKLPDQEVTCWDMQEKNH